MRRDFPHAGVSVATLESQLSADVRHFLLLNDNLDREIEGRYRDRPHYDFRCRGRNIGVPAGRNLLISTAMDWGADYFITFDDDLLAPSDYVAQLIEERRRLARDEAVGIVAPAVLDYQSLHTRVLTADEIEAVGHYDAVRLGDNATLRRRLRGAGDDPGPRAVEHLGIRDWRTHYLGVGKRAFLRWATRYVETDALPAPSLPTALRADEAARRTLTAGDCPPLAVDTLPGGVSCFDRALVETLGPIDEAFGPFGFEDSDFGIRARRAGFANYCIPKVIVLHDFQKRLRSRQPKEVLASRGRARALLLRKHAGPDLASGALFAVLEPVDAFAATGDGHTDAAVRLEWTRAFYAAFIEALFRRIDDEDHQSRPAVGPRRGVTRIPLPDRPFTPSSTIEVTCNVEFRDNALRVDELSVRWPDGARIRLSGSVRCLESRSQAGSFDELVVQHAELVLAGSGLLGYIATLLGVDTAVLRHTLATFAETLSGSGRNAMLGLVDLDDSSRLTLMLTRRGRRLRFGRRRHLTDDALSLEVSTLNEPSQTDREPNR